GRLIAGRLRPGDTAARFGGDEFVAVLPGTRTDAALELADGIRRDVAALAKPDGMDADITRLTASIGVATCPDAAGDADGLFRVADRALYRVKNGGKNAVAAAAALTRPS